MKQDSVIGRCGLFLAVSLVASMLAMPAPLIDVVQPHGKAALSSSDNLAEAAQPSIPGLLTDTGLLRYIFHSAVDVGLESQPFYFTLLANTTVFTNGSYLSAELTYEPLGAGLCDLDLSVWDANDLRTGGNSSGHLTPQAQIPSSMRTEPENNGELVEVVSVPRTDEGLWSASVYCNPSSVIGARFTLTVSILLDQRIPVGRDGPRFEFNVPSNVNKIETHLEYLETMNLDLSVWDGFGRRTGGWTFRDPVVRTWIPNSVYNGSIYFPETIGVYPVLSVDDPQHSGVLWGVGASYRLTISPGYYALTVELTFDTDSDGVVDSMDIDPTRDLCVRLHVTGLRQLDPLDDDNRWDPYVRIAVGESVTKGLAQGGQGDAWGSNIWRRSKVPIVQDSDFSGDYSMWLNVPDSLPSVPLLIQVWDHDKQGDDICDVSPVSGGGSEKDQDSSTLHIVYDLLAESWTGDVSTGYASGESDGSQGTSNGNDQDDADIAFQMTTEAEIGYQDKGMLANKFDPMLYLDPLEHAGPIEMWSMLNQSELRDSKSKVLLSSLPVGERPLVQHRNDSYMRLRERNTTSYMPQIYANVMTSDNDTIVLQYWFFYLYDSVSPHQGDWEMIQISFEQWSRDELLGGIMPVELAYSQHYGGEVRAWNASGLTVNGTHPGVFVTLGGHSSIFTGPVGHGKAYPVTVMSPSPWLNFTGRWGSSRWQFGPGGNSVPGPVYRSSMHRNWLGKPTSPIAYIWHEPLYWEANLE